MSLAVLMLVFGIADKVLAFFLGGSSIIIARIRYFDLIDRRIRSRAPSERAASQKVSLYWMAIFGASSALLFGVYWLLFGLFAHGYMLFIYSSMSAFVLIALLEIIDREIKGPAMALFIAAGIISLNFIDREVRPMIEDFLEQAGV